MIPNREGLNHFDKLEKIYLRHPCTGVRVSKIYKIVGFDLPTTPIDQRKSPFISEIQNDFYILLRCV